MPTATNDTYTAAAGATIYAGRTAPVALPAWLAGKPLNQLFQIAGTSGAGGASADEFSDIALRTDTSEIFGACMAGHHLSDNRVVSIDLRLNAPAWVLRSAPTPDDGSRTADSAYYTDGKPSGRHVYAAVSWSQSANRIMLVGNRYPYGLGFAQLWVVDGFNPDSNTWDAAGTWPNVPTPGFGVTTAGPDLVFTQSLDRLQPSTKSWLTKATGGSVRYPVTFDGLRNQIFGLCWGDGESYSSGMSAYKMGVTGSSATAITFNASAAYTQWLADTPAYATMVYDPDGDRFLFFPGGTWARIYVIKPNAGTAWDMTFFTPDAGSDNIGAIAGAIAKAKYVPALKGIVMMPAAASNLYFLRTA